MAKVTDALADKANQVFKVAGCKYVEVENVPYIMFTELKNGSKIQTKTVPNNANVWLYLCPMNFSLLAVAYLSFLLNIKEATEPIVDPNKNNLIVNPLSPITCLQNIISLKQ